jgi:hypoxanthine phosphoribosyltransferase
MFKHTMLISEDQLQRRVAELAETLNREFANTTIDIICVLTGAVFFAADVMRMLKMPTRLNFVKVSSYDSGTENSGTVNLHFSSAIDLQGRTVILFEDILDTGITLDYLLKHLREKNPQTLKVCVLLDKPERRKIDLQPDYIGFQIPDEFVIGYGLDYQELGRNLKYIAVLDPSEYRQ